MRAPPGVYQILETVNKLDKTNESFGNDLVKFLKSTGLISFDKFQKLKATIDHSFGQVKYSFDMFVEKNKYYISPEYRKLFDNLGLDFLGKHELQVETVNKYYKSDIYRNFLTNFLLEIKPDDAFFVNCINCENKDQSSWLVQLEAFKVESLAQVLKQLHPVKMTARDFCQKYLELYPEEQRTFEEVEATHPHLPTLAQQIYLALFKGGRMSDALFGSSKVFLKTQAFLEIEGMLKEARKMFEKWKGYLKIKIANYRAYVKRKRFIRMIRILKAFGRYCLHSLILKLHDRPKFDELRRRVRRAQHIYRFRSGTGKLIKAMAYLKKFKRRMVTFIIRFRFLKKRRIMVYLQRRIIGFLAKMKLKRVLFIKQIIRKIRERALQIASHKIVHNCLKSVASLVYRRYFFERHKDKFDALRDYLYRQVAEKRTIRVQSTWRGYRARKKYNSLQKAVVYVQKNMLRFMWRKNYLIMKRGIVMIQRLFRKKRSITGSQVYQEMLYQSRIRHTIIDGVSSTLKKLMESLKHRLLETAKIGSNRLKTGQKIDRQNYFSYIIDIEINDSVDQETARNFLAYFTQLDKRLTRDSEELLDLSLCDSHIWSITNRFNSYCWGKCDFIPAISSKANKEAFNFDRSSTLQASYPTIGMANTNGGIMPNTARQTTNFNHTFQEQNNNKQAIDEDEVVSSIQLRKLEFHGSWPQFILSGSDFTAFYYRNANEIKYFGDFEIYGSREIIKKRNANVTTKFNEDFIVKQLSSTHNTFGLVSEQGEALLWPFYNFAKQITSRIRVHLDERIEEVACGQNFAALRTRSGKVFTVSDGNAHGELGIGNFERSKQMHMVAFFTDRKDPVVQLAAGNDHLLVLTLGNNIYAWGSNFKGQLGSKFGINYCLPRYVRLPEKDRVGSKILKISAGKHSSHAILKNNKVFWWGTNGTIKNQKYPIEYQSPFFEVL